jgi:hypothetical protein
MPLVGSPRAIHNYFYKVDANGDIDSVLVRDFNDSITYMFRYAFVEGDFIYWLGVYVVPAPRRLDSKGYAVVKTDENMQIVDRVIVPHHERVNVIDFHYESDNIYLSLLEVQSQYRLWLSQVNISSGLSLVKDTLYPNTPALSGSLIKTGNLLRIPEHNSSLYHTVDAVNYTYYGLDTLVPNFQPFFRFRVGNMSVYKDTLLLSNFSFQWSFMLHDFNMNLIDTFSLHPISPGTYNHGHHRGADVVVGKNYYYGGYEPAPAVLDLNWQADIRVFKIHDFSHEWDCLVTDDSINKIITSMFASDDGSIIYLVYNEYDHRKGNLERNVVVTTMDTMCNVLSTSKINIDDSFV